MGDDFYISQYVDFPEEHAKETEECTDRFCGVVRKSHNFYKVWNRGCEICDNELAKVRGGGLLAGLLLLGGARGRASLPPCRLSRTMKRLPPFPSKPFQRHPPPAICHLPLPSHSTDAGWRTLRRSARRWRACATASQRLWTGAG